MESTANPEFGRKSSPLEAVHRVVEKVRSAIADKKKLALITAAAGLTLLSACGTYTETSIDTRQATVLEVQPIDISGLQSGQLEFVQTERDRVVDVLRGFVSDDILNHYNDVNLEATPNLIRQQEIYSKYGNGKREWGGVLYPKGKENTLLGLGGNKYNTFGSGENVPFIIIVDNEGNVDLNISPFRSPEYTGRDKQGKRVDAGNPNGIYQRTFIPEIDHLRIDEGEGKTIGIIPLTRRETAAKKMLKIPAGVNFEPRTRIGADSIPLTWSYNLPDGREVLGSMNASSNIFVKVIASKSNH